MAKAAIAATVKIPSAQIARQAEAFCSTPAKWARGWTLNDCECDPRSGSVYLKPVWSPATYPYGKNDYQTFPVDKSLWIESGGALGRGDKAIGWAGNSTNAASTPWSAFLTSGNAIGRCRGVVLSFLWYRPADATYPLLHLYPRLDPTRYSDVGSIRYYFVPLRLTIDEQMMLTVYEYPYDTYEQFTAATINCFQKQGSYPLVVSPEDLAAKWHSVTIMSMSDDDLLVTSDILRDGGFLYRSALDRNNIFTMPEGVAGIQSNVGGLSQVQVTPLQTAATGTLKSTTLSKSGTDAVYPALKVFGWDPAMIATDRGFLTNQTIASGATGTGGFKYNIYAVTKDILGQDVETLVDPTAPTEFKDFKVELILTPTSNVSPVVNDLVVDFAQDTATVVDTGTDVAADIVEITGQSSNDGSVRFNMRLRNQDGIYNTIAERMNNQIDLDVEDQHFATLYTLNPGYDWWKTPTEGALELQWECGDGMVYLERELCARMPAYDGMLLSDALTDFMGRLGYEAARLDIEATTVRLPKKKANEKPQFKPEDGTPAVDVIKKWKEWFAGTFTCRFTAEDKFEFKSIPLDGDGFENPTISRIYYADSDSKPTADDHVVYRDAQVELLMDQYYNEIWVVGEDPRNNQPLIAVWQDKDSQTNKDSPRYVGRRLLMIVLTRCNTQEAVAGICTRLSTFYGDWGVRLTFNTRLDTQLKKDDFIEVSGVAAVWRVTDIDYGLTLQAMTNSAINSTTPPIRGMKVTAIQWPVLW